MIGGMDILMRSRTDRGGLIEVVCVYTPNKANTVSYSSLCIYYKEVYGILQIGLHACMQSVNGVVVVIEEVHTHIHIHAWMNNPCAHTHTCTNTHRVVCMCMHMCRHVLYALIISPLELDPMCSCVCMYNYVGTYMCVCVYVHTYMCLYME